MAGLNEEYKICNKNLSSYKEEMEQVINKTINKIMDQLIDYFNYERIPCNQRALENLVFNLKDEIKYNTNYLKIISAQQDSFNSNNIEEITYDIETNTKKLLNSIDFGELLFHVRKDFDIMFNYNDDLTYELYNIIKIELRRLDEITHDITNDFTKQNIKKIKNTYEEKQVKDNNSKYSFVINMNPKEAVNYLKEEFKAMPETDVIKTSEEILKQIPFRTDVLANFLFEIKHGKIKDTKEIKEEKNITSFDEPINKETPKRKMTSFDPGEDYKKEEEYTKIFKDDENIFSQMMNLCKLEPDVVINYFESCFDTMTNDRIKKELNVILNHRPFDIPKEINDYLENKQKEVHEKANQNINQYAAMFK